MKFYSRKLVQPQDLNANGTLFGGTLLAWIDEEAAIYATCQLGRGNLVTKFMSEIDFVSSARQGDVIEIGLETVRFGRTSICIQCEVRNKLTRQTVVTIEQLVFVCVDADGRPVPHGIGVSEPAPPSLQQA